MENNIEHINSLLKQKFEDFAPQPPEHVWEGISAALDKGMTPVWYKTLMGKAAIITLFIMLMLGAYWSFNKNTTSENQITTAYTNTTNNTAGITNNIDNNISKSNISKPAAGDVSANNNKALSGETASNKNHELISPKPVGSKKIIYKASTSQTKTVATQQRDENHLGKLSTDEQLVNNKEAVVLSSSDKNIDWLEKKSIGLFTPPVKPPVFNVNDENNNQYSGSGKKQTGKWALGFYFAPEFIADPFDSLTIQNSYALSVEPVYYFNSHWFIRPGLGFQYSRDKGFVKANYQSWDYLGSYQDVIDVTFDTTGGVVTPVYHTQTVEVYDSIRHITISEETNRYLYLQTSLVVGYHNHTNKLGWSVYAGSEVNFLIADRKDNPFKSGVSIVSDNNLAHRKSPQYSLKIGFGLDYAIGKNWLVTVEPEYRYFINGLNGGGIYNNPLSGVGARFGFIYTLK